MLELLIKNAEVIDGSGKLGFIADVGIADQHIVRIAANIHQEAERSIYATGLTVAPGFIDAHTHSDLTLFQNKGVDSSIHQGVTTIVIGNCGMSAAPHHARSFEDLQSLSMGVDITPEWRSMSEYLDRVTNSGISTNIVPFVGHSNIRYSVMGDSTQPPTEKQQLEMERLVELAMHQGARGISTGLYYPPGYFANTSEIVGLAKVASKYGGIYTSHVRNESNLILSAIIEAIEIGEQAEIQIEISHIKISGFRNWHMIGDLIQLLESKRAQGVNLGCDQYPYNASCTFLSTTLPYWAQEGGGTAIARRMLDREVRAQIIRDWNENRREWDHRNGVENWNDILVADCASRPEINGKSLTDIASGDNKDPLEVNMDLLSLDNAQALAIFFDQGIENVTRLISLPCVIIGSDSAGRDMDGVRGRGSPHPRCFGTFPRVLGEYVRERKDLSLPEAIKKMTSQSAERFHLADRGVIKEGAWADLVLFNAGTVRDMATYKYPHQHPEGISYVIINGSIVLDQGRPTGALPGLIL